MSKLIIGVNDLATVRPDLIKEWDFEKNVILPSQVGIGSSKKVCWVCNKGHRWQTEIRLRVIQKHDCPYCKGAKVLEGYNDLYTLYPDIAKKWNYNRNLGLSPKEVAGKSSKRVWWQCNKGHEWQATVNDMVTKELICPYCSNKKVLKGYNDLATVRPDLIKSWNFSKNEIRPDEVTSGSSKEVWWQCEKGHEWIMRIKNRSRGSGCPYCSNRKVLREYNSLIEEDLDLLREWNYERNGNLTPDKVTKGSKQKVWWKCEKGHEWQAIIAHRIKGVGCPYCSNRKVLKGYNDLATLRPDLVKEWNYEKNKDLIPEMFMCGSAKKVWWSCSEKHEWQAVIYHRVRGSGCPYCVGKRVIKGKNDLAVLRPDLVKEWNYKRNEDLVPSMFKLNSSTKVWWVCEKGHEWEAKIQHRNNGADCPYCSKIRYKNRIVYNFITNLVTESYYKCECQKCGYSNILTIDEMKQHYDKCFGKG